MAIVSEIRFSDPGLCQRVERIQRLRGTRTRNQAARDLLTERLAQIEEQIGHEPDDRERQSA